MTASIAESIIDDPHTYNLFLFLLNTPEFQRLVQRITGCHRVADFQGRIYRLNSTTGDRIVWHTDVYDHRVVTFSLNIDGARVSRVDFADPISRLG